MAIEPIKGFYVHDEATDTDGVALISIDAVTGYLNDDKLLSFSLSELETERGGWANGVKDNSLPTLRIRTAKPLRVKAGTQIVNTGTSLWYGVQCVSSNGVNTDSGWISDQNAVYTAPADGALLISLRKSDGAISDDEMAEAFSNIHVIVQDDDILYNVEKTEFTNAYTENDVLLNSTGKTTFETSLFSMGGLSSGTFNGMMRYRVATPDIIQFDYPLHIVADDGYKFGVHLFTDAGAFESDLGWQTSFTVPANKKFKIVIANSVETYAQVYQGVEWALVQHVKFNTKLGYDVEQLKENPSYSYTNNTPALNTKRQKYNVEQMSVQSTPAGDIIPNSSNQGMTIYNGVIFQLYSNDKVELIDLDTGASIAILDITSDHGDTIDFSNEYYEEGDEFPLAYITADTTPAKVYVNRITREGTTLVKTYVFPADKTGYYAGHSLDPANMVLYQVGYTENSYYQDPNGTNYLIVSVWDLKNVTDNGNDTYTTAFMRSFKLPFYTTLQGQAFFNGLIVVVSSHWENAETKVLFIDPGKEAITTLLDNFPSSVKNVECEGIAFVPDGDKYYSVIKTNNTHYYRIDFS